MTTRITKQRFDNLRSVGGGQVVEDIELDQCTFVGSSLVQWDDPNPSLVVRRIRATRCTLDNCTVVGTRFEDVSVEHLAIKGGMLYLNGCVFSRVRISGRIGPLMAVSPMPKPREKPSPVAEQSIIRAYESIDWALDVSGAEFTDVSLDYVPGDLVRRDPETQFLLHRQRLADLDHRALPIDADIYLSRFEHSPFDSMVAVAPKRSRHFRDLLRILERLRELGLAE